MLHPSRAGSRSGRGRRRSQAGLHDTSGTSGSDTAGSDIDEPGARAVTFRVEYHDRATTPVRKKGTTQPPGRPDIIVSSASAIGRGGIINTEG